ncbi:ATP-binding protein [Paracerasibacillus soli]|uniref:histidine kinase n=2 Tax=Paracerasibacillus soli TaxID=480284 RepID=A0ABU5CMZ6_9BACI|nr:ATP-binding protein [Virgibacillus soli]MDY0407615.1 ATP-binding protein [Virgibacillus soli]
MLSQLIYNAVKYSKGHSKQINISLFEQQEAAIIEIEDFGIGIPPNDMRRIFDAFYTGQNGRLYRESTGMGLFLVKEVTQYLQHNVEVKSEVGKGSRFRIIFSPTQNLTKM